MSFNWPADELTVKEKIGVGTDTPSERLEVRGNIKLNSGVAIGEFSSDGTFASPSNQATPTTQAVKTYVDGLTTTLNTALATKADKGGSLVQNFQTNNLTVQGNLDVTGTTTFRNIEQHQGDVELGNEDTDQVMIRGVMRSTHASGKLQLSSPLQVSGPVTVSDTVTAVKFMGDGSGLTGLPGVTQWSSGAGGSISYNGGNVGIGTISPTQKLQVIGNAKINNTFLGDVGHGGSWAGFSHGNSASTSGYALLQRTDGLYTLMNKRSGGGYLGFRVDNADKMIINDSGNVGIGLLEPRTQLHVLGRISTGADFTSAGSITFFPPDGFAWFHIDNGPAGGRPTGRLRISHGGTPGAQEIISILQNKNVGIGTSTPAFKLDVAGAAHASSFPTSSDVRLKTRVSQLAGVLEKLDKIRGISFEWNELYESLGRSTGHREIGVTAQEVEAVFPELVTTWGEEGYKAVDYGRLAGVLIEAVKELKAENESLKRRMEALER